MDPQYIGVLTFLLSYLSRDTGICKRWHKVTISESLFKWRGLQRQRDSGPSISEYKLLVCNLVISWMWGGVSTELNGSCYWRHNSLQIRDQRFVPPLCKNSNLFYIHQTPILYRGGHLYLVVFYPEWRNNSFSIRHRGFILPLRKNSNLLYISRDHNRL